MSVQLNFADRLRVIIVPTPVQVLGSISAALLILVLAQSQSLLKVIGATGPLLVASQSQFQLRLDALLTSPVISQLTLITFWAAVGLLSYLICWGVYNIFIEARNEVTLSTAYTNRGGRHWRGPHETLALKSASALGLALMVGSLRFGVPFWLAATAQAFGQPNLQNLFGAVLSVVGLSLQLYLILLFIQLTFTPWYRIQTFTDV